MPCGKKSVCGARLVRTRSDPFEPVRAVSEKVPRNATVSAVGTLAGLTHTTLSLTTLTVHSDSPQPLQLGLGLQLEQVVDHLVQETFMKSDLY